MISHELKFIFIHIEKTAGSSVEWLLKDLSSDIIKFNDDQRYIKYKDIHVESPELTSKGLGAKGYPVCNNAKHLTIHELREFYGDKIVDEYFKFTIVRNPYDRALSAYFFWYVPDKNTFDGKINIQQFIWMLQNQLRPQSEAVDDTVYIVKYESLIPDLNQISFFTEKGITFDYMPHFNKSTNKSINYNKNKLTTDILPTELKEHIYNYYKNDFIKFGYSK